MKRSMQRTGGSPPCPILLVEDDPDVRESLAEVLAEEAFTVHTAQDGLEALEVLRELPRPCVVLLDWLMPQLDGAGLLRQLEHQGDFEGLTILVTTNFQGRILDERVTQVLRKPYELDELLRMLNRHCYPPFS